MPAFIDRSGIRYGRLVVIKQEPRGKGDRVRWSCVCDCGATPTIASSQLGRTKSCGCLQREVTSTTNSRHRHALPKKVERTYSAWIGAKMRCYNPNDSSYGRYGARGIKMCDEWVNDYTKFISDMGPAPKGKTLDRIDVDGDYDIANCKWSEPVDQAKNRRSSLRPTAVHQTLKDYAMDMNVPYKALHYLHRTKKLSLSDAVRELKRRPSACA